MPQQTDDFPLLTSVAVVCRQVPRVAAESQVLRLIEEYVDISRTISFWLIFDRPLSLVKRVFARIGYHPQMAVEGLCLAAFSQNLDMMKWLCLRGEEVASLRTCDLVNEKGTHLMRLPLCVAATAGNLTMVQWLIESGARVSERDCHGETALHEASSDGHLSVVQFLVDKGALVNEMDRYGSTALHKAAASGHLHVVDWLLSNGASINFKNGEGQTALHAAANGGHLLVALVLVSSGALIHEKDNSDQTALHLAVRGNHFATVQYLVGNMTRSYELDKWGQTALYYATITGRFDIVELFLSRCKTEMPPAADLRHVLFVAAEANHIGIVAYLDVVLGVDLHFRSESGRTALHEAAVGGAMTVVRYLLERGLNACLPDSFGVTPVIDACRHHQLKVLLRLLEAGARPDDVDHAGRSALHYVCDDKASRVNAKDRLAIVKVLLEHHADVNCYDKSRWTPLHCAAAAGDLELIKLLVSNGSAVNVQTAFGKTAMEFALEREKWQVAEYLKDRSSASVIRDVGHNDWEANYREFLIDASDIDFDSIVWHGNGEGSWLDAPISVKVWEPWRSNTKFVEELDQWSRLNHPHVVKLYGACHDKKANTRSFVYERPTRGSLITYLWEGIHCDVWEKLYEAALGLQYLHDRGLPHGGIRGEGIVIAANGVAKLKNADTEAESHLDWTAPEVLCGSPPTFASDVYAFGMTIVQAVKIASSPWNLAHFGIHRGDTENAFIREAILSGKLPDVPGSMNAAQWQLVTRMCSYNPRDRISSSDVVRELEMFTKDYKTLSSELEEEGVPSCWADLGDVHIQGSSESTIAAILTEIENMSAGATPMDLMNRNVLDRVTDVFEQLKARLDKPVADLIQQFSTVLHCFHTRLQSTRTIGSTEAARFAASRQEADNSFSVHGDLDSLIQTWGLSTASTMHKWREQWSCFRSRQQKDMFEKLGDVPALLKDTQDDAEREDSLTYLRFELSKRAGSYALGGSTVSQLTTGNNLSWFIPAYEVEFDKLNEFSSGAFGTVHLGKWNHARVVVKKVKLATAACRASSLSWSMNVKSTSADKRHSEEIQAAFLNEVEIWHKLYHPHVVQLYGACHIDQPFFVCEYAGGGQLDDYLRVHPDQVWPKLLEAALGLRYLHVKRVVHSDLKCNNILIGNDGRAKLTDFGLSTLETAAEGEEADLEEINEKPKVGAIRWKAPEVLRGVKATFSSDIYSFGMCILEAVSGRYPWGMTIPDAAVKYYVLKEHRIPQRPANCSDKGYELVLQMCKYEPSERKSIKEVISALNELQ